VQLQLTVGREESGAAPGRTAPNDVLVDQNDFQPLAKELRRSRHARESGTHDGDIALDVLRQRRAVLVLTHHQRGEPPVLIDQAHRISPRRASKGSTLVRGNCRPA
jgi:hypothetical protein